MAEDILVRLNSNTGASTPQEACQLLSTISKSVDVINDHVIVDLVCKIVKNCEVSAGVTVPGPEETNSQGSARPCSYKDLKNVIEFGISPIQNMIYKLDKMGFTSIGKELEIKIKLETIAEILTQFNEDAYSAGRSTQVTWEVQERIDEVTRTVIEQLQAEYRYKKNPKVISWSNRLGLKLSRTQVKDIIRQAANAQCCNCSNLLVNLEFAILDACSDLFCTNCAHRCFNKPGEPRIVCPACQSPVGAYTLARDFHLHERSSPGKSVFKSITKAISLKINKGYDSL